MKEIDPIEALQACGLSPIIVDENTDFDEILTQDYADDGVPLELRGRQLETNTEFLDRVMNFGCPTGALIQGFVIEALNYYCQTVADATMPDNGFVTAIAWKKTAEWLKGELDKKYGSAK